MCQNIFESVIYTLTRVVKCLKINSEFKKKNLEGYIIIDDRDSQNYMYIYLKIRYFETFLMIK